MPDPLDAPMPPFRVPVRFLDGSLAGQWVETPNDVHSYKRRETGEEWVRYSEAPDGVLRSYFKLRAQVVKNGH